MATEQQRPSLEYVPGAPVRRRRRVRRVMTVFVIVAVGWAGWRFGPAYVLRARQIYWQRQCMHFTAPPGTIVYERLPAGSNKPAVEEPYIDWDSSQVTARRRLFVKSDKIGSTRPSPVISQKGPGCLLWFGVALPGWPADCGAVLFCHERISPAGHRRLVTISMPDSNDWIRGDLLPAAMQHTVCPVIPWYGGLPIPDSPRSFYGSSGPALPPPKRIYAGVADPQDATHFSIEYEWPDGVHGFIDGWLDDDDRVTLKFRPGPGDVRSAFQRGLHHATQ